ncbi:MAG: hypothetical protein IPL10_20230 [Bacteroidetes bacterium]|nr:hypothetical protein [Bacteroidota bacterium]
MKKIYSSNDNFNELVKMKETGNFSRIELSLTNPNIDFTIQKSLKEAIKYEIILLNSNVKK